MVRLLTFGVTTLISRFGFSIALSFLLGLACGGDDRAGTEPKPEPKTEAPSGSEPMDHGEPPVDEPPQEAAKPDASGQIVFEVGDLIKFDIYRFEVVTGSTVKIVLKHTGSLPKEAMGHNIVILKPGNDMMAFATAAITARETDFIPPGMVDQVLANTSMVGGGETTTLEFTAPAPGEYVYVCTFPGHAAVMNGKMIVTES